MGDYLFISAQCFQHFLANLILFVRVGDRLQLLIGDVKHILSATAYGGYFCAVQIDLLLDKGAPYFR